MTTEDKALVLLNEVSLYKCENVDTAPHKDLCTALRRAIEQHEAFRQEVSDIVNAYIHSDGEDEWNKLKSLITPKPDPLIEVLTEISGEGGFDNFDHYAHNLRAALEARGLEIRSKNDD